jgi:hypothetical protein
LVKRLSEQLASFQQPITEAEQLDEINMGGKSLRKLSKSIDALAGMEFEMIVPNVEGGDYSGDEEPDYDSDEGDMPAGMRFPKNRVSGRGCEGSSGSI